MSAKIRKKRAISKCGVCQSPGHNRQRCPELIAKQNKEYLIATARESCEILSGSSSTPDQVEDLVPQDTLKHLVTSVGVLTSLQLKSQDSELWVKNLHKKTSLHNIPTVVEAAVDVVLAEVKECWNNLCPVERSRLLVSPLSSTLREARRGRTADWRRNPLLPKILRLTGLPVLLQPDSRICSLEQLGIATQVIQHAWVCRRKASKLIVAKETASLPGVQVGRGGINYFAACHKGDPLCWSIIDCVRLISEAWATENSDASESSQACSSRVEEVKRDDQTDFLDQWLVALGLAEYQELFKKEKIESAEDLSDLSEGDLVQIGVVALGHRKRMMKGIAQLKVSIPNQQPAESTEPLSPELSNQTLDSVDTIPARKSAKRTNRKKSSLSSKKKRKN